MRTNIIIILLLSFSLSQIQAQHAIEGYVKLSDTEEPATGAYVHIADIERLTVVDENGFFRLDNLRTGAYTLEISYIGYQTLLEVVNITDAEQVVRLALSLSPKAYELEGVVISGGYITTQDDNAIKIEKIDARDLQGATHFLDALARLPGIENLSRGPGIGKPVIRGLSNNQVVVLNNGIRNENFQYSSAHPIGLDEWGIERIEVIKGPASLLYGSGAIGGVVNMVKEKPAAPGTFSGEAMTQYHSNTQGYAGTAGIKAGSESFFGGLQVGGKSHSDYLDGNGNFVPNTRFNTLALRAHAGYRDDHFVSKLYYDFDGQQLGMFSGFTKQNITERGRQLDVWYQNLDNHLLNWQNTLVFHNFQIKANASWQSNHRRLQNPKTSVEQPDLGAPINMWMETFTYDAKLIRRSNEQLRFILGFQGMSSANRNDQQARNIILPDGQMNDYGLFGLIQYQPNTELNTQLGLRYDLRDISTKAANIGEPSEKQPVNEQFSNISASLGATYHFSDKWLLRANAASGFRAPNFIELSANGLHGSLWERGNTDLHPERSYELDLSGHYHGRHLTVEVASFLNVLNNYIFLQPTSEAAPQGGGVIFEYSQSDSRLHGFEAGLHLHPESMEWLHLASTYATVHGEQEDGSYLPLIPANNWSNEIGIHGDLSKNIYNASITLNVHHYFEQDRFSRFEQVTEAYTLLHLHLKADLKLSGQQLQGQIAVNNLLDEAYLNHLSILRPLEVLNPGRNVVVTLRWVFSGKSIQ